MLDFIKSIFISMIHIPQQLLLLFIRFYQKTLSPDHGLLKDRFPGGFCRFTPSCSEYARLAILRHGATKGGIKAVWRILRCNPCSKGGVDFPK